MEIRRGDVIINVDRSDIGAAEKSFMEGHADLLMGYLTSSQRIKVAASLLLAGVSRELYNLAMKER